jgi:hypothetical protein
VIAVVIMMMVPTTTVKSATGLHDAAGQREANQQQDNHFHRGLSFLTELLKSLVMMTFFMTVFLPTMFVPIMLFASMFPTTRITLVLILLIHRLNGHRPSRARS